MSKPFRPNKLPQIATEYQGDPFATQRNEKQRATRAAVIEWLETKRNRGVPEATIRSCCFAHRDTEKMLQAHFSSMEHIGNKWGTTEQEMQNDLQVYLAYQNRRRA